MVVIKEIESRQKDTELEIHELKERIQEFEESIQEKSAENKMRVSFEKLIMDKQLITKSELDRYEERMRTLVQENQVKLLKWIVGTGLSTIAAITGIVGIFYR
ncbi:hypothetical protein CIL03_00560 [Virgibacillus indicus]|uniref:Uncharacterized protein n=1 Tax=Virgibacillus indicus TaxID=2024554 RepID=A0A265ND02_9BACI|nr:hypothetical protein [Virgibacillus indicus]OZU89665.1 hypothetical protein CIL03_00560 [Virgibacillus indicus]